MSEATVAFFAWIDMKMNKAAIMAVENHDRSARPFPCARRCNSEKAWPAIYPQMPISVAIAYNVPKDHIDQEESLRRHAFLQQASGDRVIDPPNDRCTEGVEKPEHGVRACFESAQPCKR